MRWNDSKPIRTTVELKAALEGVPLDPRTGLPPGYRWFAAALHKRREEKRRSRALRQQSRAQPTPPQFLAELRAQAQASLKRKP